MPASERRQSAVGAVLAGGASRRLGRPKATVELGGRSLISYPLDAVAAAGLEPVVVAKADSPLPRLDCEIVHEPAGPRHPLTGIVTALRVCGGRPVIATACDMPFLEPRMLEALAALEEPLVLGVVSGILQPFPGRYVASLVDQLELALERRLALTQALAGASPRVLGEAELSAFGEPGWLCFGVNDEAELATAEHELASRRAVGS